MVMTCRCVMLVQTSKQIKRIQALIIEQLHWHTCWGFEMGCQNTVCAMNFLGLYVNSYIDGGHQSLY